MSTSTSGVWGTLRSAKEFWKEVVDAEAEEATGGVRGGGVGVAFKLLLAAAGLKELTKEGPYVRRSPAKLSKDNPAPGAADGGCVDPGAPGGGACPLAGVLLMTLQTNSQSCPIRLCAKATTFDCMEMIPESMLASFLAKKGCR